MPDFDLIILGGGPAGYVGAIRAAQLGAKTAIIEERDFGGTCLNRGCIPSKALIHCAHLLDEAAGSKRYGITFGEPQVDLDGVRKHADRVVKTLVGGVEGLLKGNKVVAVKGRGVVAGPHEVTVTNEAGKSRTVSARYILVATGSSPLILPIPGSDSPGVFTSDEAVKLPGPYADLAIIGAGAIGCEFAYIYSRFGAKVTIIEMLDRIVPTEDPEVTDVLAKSLKKAGISIQTGARCGAIEQADGRLRLVYEQGGEEKALPADAVLMAAGRRAVTAGIGLEEVGVVLDRGRMKVDEHLKTDVDSIYGAGDCLRGIGLAHQASHEAVSVVETLFGDGGHMNYDAVPAAIYTYPQIASVGLREHEAVARGIEVKVGRMPFAAIGKAGAIGEREGMMKLVVEASTGRLLGGCAVGPEVTELMAEVALAVEHKLTAADVAQAIHSHPTLSEITGEAALAVMGRAIHTL